MRCRPWRRYFWMILASLILFGRFAAAAEDIPVIHYRLKWLLNASVAGDIYADVYGMFRQSGLDVVIKPGGPERDAIKEIELGRAQFGVASADQIIRALDKGARVTVIAQLFQKNPLQWIYRTKTTAIRSPADLRGKTVGITYGGIDENIMNALLAKHRIDPSELTLYSVRYDFTPFYQGKVDLWPIYRNAQGPIIGKKLAGAGETIGYFDPDAYGVKSVANSVVTSKGLLANHPETVRAFASALLTGWELAMAPANAEKTLQAVHRFDKDTPLPILRKQLSLTRGFIKPDPETAIGVIDGPAWRDTERMMVRQGLISGPVGIGDHLEDLSTGR